MKIAPPSFKKSALLVHLVMMMFLFLPLCFSLTSGFSLPFAQAQRVNNPLAFTSIPGIIGGILDVLLILAVPVVIFFIIYAGFLYVTAQGNSSKISEANRALLYALIGGVIILGARVIGGIVQSTVQSITGG